MAKKEGRFKKRRKLYIALEDKVDFVWDSFDIPEVIQLWNGGISIQDISKRVKRPVDDVFIILYDQALEGNIESRHGSIFGDIQ